VTPRTVLLVGEPSDVSRQLKAKGAQLTFARDEADAAHELADSDFDAVIVSGRALVDAVKSGAPFPSLHLALTPTTSFANVMMDETEAKVRTRHARTPFFVVASGGAYEIVVHGSAGVRSDLSLVEAVMSLDVNGLAG